MNIKHQPKIINRKLNDININLLAKDMRDELNRLPKHIRDIIVINKPVHKLQPSNYSNSTGSKEIMDLEEKMINNYCINDKSLYDMTHEEVLDGFVMRVLPAGTNFYNTNHIFITEGQFKDACIYNQNKPIWIGNKYFCYFFARQSEGVLLSLKVDKPIYLLDIFNLDNLDRIHDILLNEPNDSFEKYDDKHMFSYLISDYNEDNYQKKIFLKLFYIKYGYKITLSQKIHDIYKILKNTNSEHIINIYTDDYASGKTYNYCNTYKVNGVNPINEIDAIYLLLKNKLTVNAEKIIYKILSIKNVKYDGIIRGAIKSDLDEGGVYLLEELTLKGSALLNKTHFDYSDNLNWVNWKKYKKYKGLQFNNTMYKKISYNISYIFTVFDYYLKNKPKNIKLKKKYIMSYNINSFDNFITNASDNANNVFDLIKKYINNLKIAILIEYPLDKIHIINEKIGSLFNYIEYTNVGENKKQILVLSNNKYIKKKIIVNISLSSDELIHIGKKITTHYNNKYYTHETKYNDITKFSEIDRNIIILYTNYGLISCVQLEHGFFDKYKSDNDESENESIIIKKINTAIRLKMIDTVLKYEPDIIIGDFNFTLDDEETYYLQSKNYYPEPYKKKLSTPTNRTDHCFMKDKFVGKNKLLKCNYSMHLPMIQSIKKI